MDLDLNLAGFANWSLSILTLKFCSCSTPNRLKSKLKNNKLPPIQNYCVLYDKHNIRTP